MSKGTVKQAAELLDRFFRDAEGRTNRQLDVYFTLKDMKLSSDKAEPAMEYLVSRGLVNAFGPDIAFLTDLGVEAVTKELDLGELPKVLRDFEQVPVPSDGTDAPDEVADTGREVPERPQVVHIGLDGNEFIVPLSWRCTVGRGPANDIAVEDQRASKNHVEIRYEDGGYVLHDLESANGTLLNGEYVVEPTPLKHDDEIVIGRTMLLVQCPDPVPVPDGAPPEAVSEAPSPASLPPTERPGPAEFPPDMPVIMGTPDLAAAPAEDRGIPEAMSSPPGGAEPVELTESAPGLAFDEDGAASNLPLPRFPPEPSSDLSAALRGAESPNPAEPVPEAQDSEPLSVVTGELASSGEEQAHPEPEYLEPEALEPMGPADEADASQDTVMTTREALFGSRPAAAEPEFEPEPETLPPGVMAPVDAEAATPLPDVEPQMPVSSDRGEEAPEAATLVGRVPEPSPEVTTSPLGEAGETLGGGQGSEPALLVLLEAVRQRLMMTSSVPDRQELLAAVELLQEHPSLQALAASIEREFGGSNSA